MLCEPLSVYTYELKEFKATWPMFIIYYNYYHICSAIIIFLLFMYHYVIQHYNIM